MLQPRLHHVDLLIQGIELLQCCSVAVFSEGLGTLSYIWRIYKDTINARPVIHTTQSVFRPYESGYFKVRKGCFSGGNLLF